MRVSLLNKTPHFSSLSQATRFAPCPRRCFSLEASSLDEQPNTIWNDRLARANQQTDLIVEKLRFGNKRRLTLVSVPKTQTPEIAAEIKTLSQDRENDALAYQFEPMKHIALKRTIFMGLSKEIVPPAGEKHPLLDMQYPLGFDEMKLEAIIYDLTEKNVTRESTQNDAAQQFTSLELNLVTSDARKELAKRYRQVIKGHLLQEGRSPFQAINLALQYGISRPGPNYLAGYPEMLHRIMLSSRLSVEDARLVFSKAIVACTQDGGDQTAAARANSLRAHTENLLAEYSFPLHEEYLASSAREMLMMHSSPVYFIGANFFEGVKERIQEGNFDEFDRLNQFPQLGEIEEVWIEILEKQVIFDSLFGTKYWRSSFIRDPFNFLVDSKQPPIDEQSREHFKEQFLSIYAEYEKIKNETFDSIYDVTKYLSFAMNREREM